MNVANVYCVTGDAGAGGLPVVFRRFALFLKRAAEDAIHCSLSVCSGMNDEPVIECS